MGSNISLGQIDISLILFDIHAAGLSSALGCWFPGSAFDQAFQWFSQCATRRTGQVTRFHGSAFSRDLAFGLLR